MLKGPIGPTLLQLAAPMVMGIAAIILFNVVDTFYVGQLGATQLAAMSYTFPVGLILMSISMGLSIGTTSTIARAIGVGDEQRVKRLTTDGLILSWLFVTLMAGLGLLTIDPLFRLVGASEALLPLIRQYMVPWYLGVGFLVIPMVGNGAIRATGDTKTPSVVMMIAGLVNMVMDPLLIFGLGPFPRLELQGAALATVISWFITFFAAFYVLIRREKMIAFERPTLKDVLTSWKQILHVGLPAAGNNILVPISAAVITRWVSSYGDTAVAAFGVGSRLESLALIGISAMSTAVTPFVGQNFGAHQCERIRAGLRFALGACGV